MPTKKEIDESLIDLTRRKLIEHKGFKNGDDSFSLTKNGKKEAEKLLKTNPDHAFMILQLSYNHGKLFDTIKWLAKLLEED